MLDDFNPFCGEWKIFFVSVSHQRSAGPNKLPFSQELIFMLALPKNLFGHNNTAA